VEPFRLQASNAATRGWRAACEENTTMNTRLIKPIFVGLSALSISAFLPSCVDAGYAYGSPHPGYRSGYVVNTLPYGYREEYVGGTRYYSHNNTYYRRQGSTYVVVDSPRHVAVRPSPSYRPPVRHDDHRDWDNKKPDWNNGKKYDGKYDGKKYDGPGNWKKSWN
jgi:hypothetical protein